MESDGKSIHEISVTMRPKIAALSKDWYRCSHFIALLSSDGQESSIEEAWRKKLFYCRFKAACGLQLLPEGQVMPCGNPCAVEDANTNQQSTNISIEPCSLENILNDLEYKSRQMSGKF